MPESYLSPKTVVAHSKNKGKGLFAKSAIKKGEIIGVKNGHLFTDNQLKEIRPCVGDYDIQIEEHLSIAPASRKEIAKGSLFLNHSCEPNVGVKGQITFVAMRNIKQGEELCYDYAMTTTHKYRLLCKCGAPSCRKTITGDDWKRKDLQKRYGSHFSQFILERIDKKTSP